MRRTEDIPIELLRGHFFSIWPYMPAWLRWGTVIGGIVLGIAIGAALGAPD